STNQTRWVTSRGRAALIGAACLSFSGPCTAKGCRLSGRGSCRRWRPWQHQPREGAGQGGGQEHQDESNGSVLSRQLRHASEGSSREQGTKGLRVVRRNRCCGGTRGAGDDG